MNETRENKVVHLPLSKELHKQLEKEAKAKGLTIVAYVRMLLIERGK